MLLLTDLLTDSPWEKCGYGSKTNKKKAFVTVLDKPFALLQTTLLKSDIKNLIIGIFFICKNQLKNNKNLADMYKFPVKTYSIQD